MQKRVNMHFDSETRRIRNASLRIATLCKFESDPDKFTEGLRTALKELNK